MNPTRPSPDPNRISLSDLCEAEYGPVVRLAASILGDEEEARDAAQEVFLSAARQWDRFRGECAPRTWLFAIALNHCRSRLRKRKLSAAVLAVLRREAASQAAARPPSLEQDAQLHLAIAGLDEPHRLPLLLRYASGLTAEEIASVLDVPVGTVYSRLHTARKRLQQHLGDDGLPPGRSGACCPDGLAGMGSPANSLEGR